MCTSSVKSVNGTHQGTSCGDSKHICRKAAGAHLAKTALAEHHQEVEVSQLHAILVAVGVEPGRSVGRLAVGVLAWADLCSLDKEEKEIGEHVTGKR